MVTWFAGLFYLPRLFVYHCEIEPKDEQHYNRFSKMERKLFWIIMTPGALLTVLLGCWLIVIYGKGYMSANPWLHVKISLVSLLLIYHVYLGYTLRKFSQAQNKHSQRFYRILNEFPTIILFSAVLLAILKPKFGG